MTGPILAMPSVRDITSSCESVDDARGSQSERQKPSEERMTGAWNYGDPYAYVDRADVGMPRSSSEIRTFRWR